MIYDYTFLTMCEAIAFRRETYKLVSPTIYTKRTFNPFTIYKLLTRK